MKIYLLIVCLHFSTFFHIFFPSPPVSLLFQWWQKNFHAVRKKLLSMWIKQQRWSCKNIWTRKKMLKWTSQLIQPQKPGFYAISDIFFILQCLHEFVHKTFWKWMQLYSSINSRAKRIKIPQNVIGIEQFDCSSTIFNYLGWTARMDAMQSTERTESLFNHHFSCILLFAYVETLTVPTWIPRRENINWISLSNPETIMKIHLLEKLPNNSIRRAKNTTQLFSISSEYKSELFDGFKHKSERKKKLKNRI